MDIKSIYHDTYVKVQEIATGDNEIFTGAGVDMKGYDSVAFIVAIQNYEAGQYVLKAQQDSQSSFATAADLKDSAQTFTTITTADTNVRILEIRQPTERYVRPILTIPNLTATTQAASIISIQYGTRGVPTGLNSGEFLASPAEGTA